MRKIQAVLLLLASLAVMLFCVTMARAEPYFRPGFSESHVGGFLKLGTPNDNVAWGVSVPAVVHDQADGFLFIPGIDWDLLDLGYAHTAEQNNLFVFGPSVNLSEPVKAVGRWACRALPRWEAGDRWTILKTALAAAEPGQAPSGVLAIGTGFGVLMNSLNTNQWRGSAQLALTVVKRF